MPDFAYIARDASGQRVTGTIDAANRRDALAALSAKALFPIDVRGDAPATAEQKSTRRASAQVLATTFAQLADLLRSGVPLLRSIEVLQRQTTRPVMKEVLGEIHDRVEQGSSLAEATSHFPRMFGEMATSMIRAGEEGGFLEEALARLAEFTETQDDLKKRTIGALIYPAVLAGIGTAVVTVLMIFFVPRFDTLFASLRQQGQLPLMTEVVLGVSRTFQNWGLWIAGLGFIFAIAARQWLATEDGRWWRDRTKLRVPMVGKIYLNLAVARFCRVLGTLLHNGVPILRSLEISSTATGNRVLGDAIQKATENISAGQRLAGPLGACGHFPPAVVEMISVAEESNTLEGVLLNVADGLERRTWRMLDLAVRLIEPIMLLLLAMIVLVLVIGLLLPVIKMSTTIR